MRTIFGSIIISIFICIINLPAQELNESFKNNVDNYIEKIRTTYEIPGVAVGIVKDGQIYYTKGFGVMNTKTKDPVTENTIFHMASVSKPFVATAIMQLVEAGKVELNKPVVGYIPYFEVTGIKHLKITVQQMLTHTSGMPDVMDYEWGQPEEPADALMRYTKSLKDEKLIFAPGEKWQYSNMAFEVLGHLIEKVSGLSFEEYIRKNILDPLGMKQSSLPDR